VIDDLATRQVHFEKGSTTMYIDDETLSFDNSAVRYMNDICCDPDGDQLMPSSDVGSAGDLGGHGKWLFWPPLSDEDLHKPIERPVYDTRPSEPVEYPPDLPSLYC